MKKYIISVIILLIILVGAYFYMNKDKSLDAQPKTIKIGLIAPLSGQFSFVGDNVVAGARLYEKEWNENKYNEGQKLSLIIEDDGFDAKKGVTAYKKLTEIDQVDAIYNVTSPTIDAIYDQVSNKAVPTMQLGEQAVPATKDSVFQITPSQTPMMEGFGAYLKNNNMAKPVLLGSNIAAYQLFAKAFKGAYVEIVEVTLPSDPAGAKVLASKLANEGYSDFIFISSPQEGAQLVKELLRVDQGKVKYHFDTSFVSGFPEYNKIIGDDMKKLEGTTVLFFADIPDNFKTKYKSFTLKDVGIGSDFGYEGVKALVETMPGLLGETGNINRGTWLENIQNLKTDGVTGEISFDQQGMRKPAFEIKKYSNGEIK